MPGNNVEDPADSNNQRSQTNVNNSNNVEDPADSNNQRSQTNGNNSNNVEEPAESDNQNIQTYANDQERIDSEARLLELQNAHLRSQQEVADAENAQLRSNVANLPLRSDSDRILRGAILFGCAFVLVILFILVETTPNSSVKAGNLTMSIDEIYSNLPSFPAEIQNWISKSDQKFNPNSYFSKATSYVATHGDDAGWTFDESISKGQLISE